MSLTDVVVYRMERRLLLLDKVGSGLIHYLVLTSDDDVRNFRLRHQPAEVLRHVYDYAACTFNNLLFVSGGYHVPSMEHFARMLKFDPSDQSWSELQPMAKARAKHAMVQYEGCLLVAGGETSGGKISPSCELYDPVSDKWSPFPRLPLPRCWLACATLNDVLYSSGGYTAGSGKDNFWTFSKECGEWHNVDCGGTVRLPWSMDRHCMLAFDNRIYILGGIRYVEKIASKSAAGSSETSVKAETLPSSFYMDASLLQKESDLLKIIDDDEQIKKANQTPWTRSDDMSNARHSAGSVILGDKMLVCGGTNTDYKRTVYMTETLYPALGEWCDEASLVADCLGSVTCAILTFTESKLIKRALPKNWPLW